MKARNMLAVAAAAVAAALPIARCEMQIIDDRALLEEERQRRLFTFTVIFEDCLGLTLTDCKDLIQREVAANPQIFESRESLNYEVANVRNIADADYYMAGLRTNLAETGVIGILGDGMIFYPWDWCDPETGCKQIGPWDCDVGTALTVTECCNLIKASVPRADENGNYLGCFPDYPVGSESNPTDYGRVSIHVNSANIVVHPPRNE